MDMVDKGMIHIPVEQDSPRFHHTTQNGVQLKIYNFFISVNFYLMLLDCGLPWVTETIECETANKGKGITVIRPCVCYLHHF